MIHANADVYIHIKESLPHNVMCEVADSLCEECGVIESELSHASHILKVVYDSEEVSGRRILESVKAVGLHASLVGL